jgi:hypothetical protein
MLRNPDPILYWNAYSKNNQTVEGYLNNAIITVNNNTYNKIIYIVSSSNDKINYNTKFIASGCMTIHQDILWRITVNNSDVNTIILDGTTYNLAGSPGLWYRTSTSIASIQYSSYNSSTKTLTLNSSAV